MARPVRFLLPWLSPILFAVFGCGRIWFEQLTLGDSDAGRGSANAGAGGVLGGSVAGTGGMSGTGGTAGTGTTGAGGTSGERGGGADGPSGGDAGSADRSCGDGVPPLITWSFDAGLDGWGVLSATDASASFSWSDSFGQPASGAFQFDALSGNGQVGQAQRQLDSAVNLSGRTVSAWVRSEAGSVTAKFIAATNLFTTASGSTVALPPGEWTCVTFDPDAPESAPAAYDSTSIRWLGVQFGGAAPFRVYLDEVSY